jgi:hypothetical protein
MCWRASDVVCCGVEQPLQQEGAPLTRVYYGSGSAKCHWCWGDCTKEEPRVGKADKSGSKFVWRWHHVACWAQKDGKMEDATTLPNFSSLDTKQQGEVRAAMEGADEPLEGVLPSLLNLALPQSTGPSPLVCVCMGLSALPHCTRRLTGGQVRRQGVDHRAAEEGSQGQPSTPQDGQQDSVDRALCRHGAQRRSTQVPQVHRDPGGRLRATTPRARDWRWIRVPRLPGKRQEGPAPHLPAADVHPR